MKPPGLLTMFLMVTLVFGVACDGYEAASPAASPATSAPPLTTSQTPAGTEQASATEPVSGDPVFDPALATELAQAVTAVLPQALGEGWDLLEEDNFRRGPPFGDLSHPSCEPLREKSAFIDERLDALAVGRSQRGYQANEAADAEVAPAVGVFVRIYDHPETAEELADTFKEVFEGEDFAVCAVDAAAATPDNPVTASVGPASAEVPGDGGSVALRVRSEGAGTALLEIYTWALGNALVEVVVGGTETLVDPAVAPAVLGAVAARLAEVAAKE